MNWEPTKLYSSQINSGADYIGQTIYYKAAPILKHVGLDLKY